MQNVAQYVQPKGCQGVNVQIGLPAASHMTMPKSMAPTMVLNNGCYPQAYYLNTFAMPAIAKLNQAALAKQMVNINKANEELNGKSYIAEEEKPEIKETKQEVQQQAPKEQQTVQSNPIKAEVAIPKELVSALEKIAKNTSNDKPKMELTDHYVKNLESYLNSQDTKLRLMAGQDVVARLQEDSERKDNPALTALTNKMLQDPELGIRSLSLAALEANIITGDEFTTQLLKQISQKQNAQEADIANKVLLRMPQ